jgi:hypothetical protein
MHHKNRPAMFPALLARSAAIFGMLCHTAMACAAACARFSLTAAKAPQRVRRRTALTGHPCHHLMAVSFFYYIACIDEHNRFASYADNRP